MALLPDSALDVLAHVLREDPDPEIRALAADALAVSGSYAAVRGLLSTLDSDDPDVLLQTLEALEFAGDESIAGEIEPLLDHADPRVRAAARETLDFL